MITHDSTVKDIDILLDLLAITIDTFEKKPVYTNY